MAVPIQTPLTSYTADGQTKVFPYKFYTTEYTDLVVQVDGQRLSAGFTITGMGNTNGGDVTFATAPAAGSDVVIFRETAVGRTAEYQDNGDLLAADINRDFDKIWLVQQEQKASNAANLARPVGGGAWDAQKYQITNLADGNQPTDAVTYGQMTRLNNSATTAAQNSATSASASDNSAKAAAASAYEAEQSRVAAWASEQLAANAAAKAGQDANTAAQNAIANTITPQLVAIQNLEYDAQQAAQSAQTNANAAGRSASAAHTSEVNATTAENNAKGYATSAQGSAQAAAQSAADASATAASVNVASINAAIAGKVDKTTYATDKATFITLPALNTTLGDYPTKADLQTALGNIQLPTNVPSTALGKTNTWLSTNVFSGTVTVNKYPVNDSDIATKLYVDTEIAKFPTAANTAVKDADNRFSAKQTFSAGLTVGAVPGQPINDNDVVGKKWITDYVTTTVSQAPAASNVVTTDTAQDITGAKTIKEVMTFSGSGAGITVDSSNPARFILTAAASVTVPEPRTGSQAATKRYVDDQLATVSASAGDSYPYEALPSNYSLDSNPEQKAYFGMGMNIQNGTMPPGLRSSHLLLIEGIVDPNGNGQRLTNFTTGEIFTRLKASPSLPYQAWVKLGGAAATVTLPATMVKTDVQNTFTENQTFNAGVTASGTVDLTASSGVHVPEPQNDTEAATKKYVDGKLAAGTSGGAVSMITVDSTTPYELNADPLQTGTLGPMGWLGPLEVNKGRVVVGRVSGFAHVPPQSILPWDSGDLLRYEIYLADTYAVSETLYNTTKGAIVTRTSKAGAGGQTNGAWTPLAGGSSIGGGGGSITIVAAPDANNPLDLDNPTIPLDAGGHVMHTAPVAVNNMPADSVFPTATASDGIVIEIYRQQTGSGDVWEMLTNLANGAMATRHGRYNNLTQTFRWDAWMKLGGAASSGSSSGGGGDVTKAGDNDFTGQNTFYGLALFNHGMSIGRSTHGTIVADMVTISGAGAGLTASTNTQIKLADAYTVTVPEPTGDNEAATKKYVDEKVAAGSSSGGAAPTNMVTIDSIQEITANKSFSGTVAIQSKIGAASGASLQIEPGPLGASPASLILAGGSSTMPMAPSFSVLKGTGGKNSQPIVNMADAQFVTVPEPTAASHAATKKYVDEKVAAGGGAVAQAPSGVSTDLDTTAYVSYLEGDFAGFKGLPPSGFSAGDKVRLTFTITIAGEHSQRAANLTTGSVYLRVATGSTWGGWSRV